MMSSVWWPSASAVVSSAYSVASVPLVGRTWNKMDARARVSRALSSRNVVMSELVARPVVLLTAVTR